MSRSGRDPSGARCEGIHALELSSSSCARQAVEARAGLWVVPRTNSERKWRRAMKSPTEMVFRGEEASKGSSSREFREEGFVVRGGLGWRRDVF